MNVRSSDAGTPRSAGARYVVEGLLASGGMGSVYRVRDPASDASFALKRIRADLRGVRAVSLAFAREYQVLAGLKHPRIIEVYDYGVDDEGPYYVMELLEGADLYALAPLPVGKVCAYLRDIATSLSLLHARRLVHRDLTPGNVRVTADGHCKLLDFGALCSFGHAWDLVGTPPYVPPEALKNGFLDQAADLFSLGAVGYLMLTGRNAFSATDVRDLPALWELPVNPPSAFQPDVPADLDALILSLLRIDPLARPASAAEVIARLNVIGALPSEDERDERRIAQSFLAHPRFVGRARELELLQKLVGEALAGTSAAASVRGATGMGRTRLLEEVALKARLEGALVLNVDATTHQEPRGVARALVTRALDEAPDVVDRLEKEAWGALVPLGRAVGDRLRDKELAPRARSARKETRGGGASDLDDALEGWFHALAAVRPLVLLVDNAELADDASLALLSLLGDPDRSTRTLVVTASLPRTSPTSKVETSRTPTLNLVVRTFELPPLSVEELRDLGHSLFGSAPNVDRLCEWLHERTAGLPLFVMETVHHLVARGVVRYVDGVWELPGERPEAELPRRLEEALANRLRGLSPAARTLAERLALLRHDPPTLPLCRLLVDAQEDARRDPPMPHSRRGVAKRGRSGEQAALVLLDELERSQVLVAEGESYRFHGVALRETLLGGIDEARRKVHHLRLGQAFARTPEPSAAQELEAGWHLLQGGDEEDGARRIAEVARDTAKVLALVSKLHEPASTFEAALEAWKRRRRPILERLPLLAGLVCCGFYQDRRWADRYGDELLDGFDEASGMATARRWQRYVGRLLALGIGLGAALVAFYMTRSKVGFRYFVGLQVRFFSCIAYLAGVAALSLDAERASAIAGVIEPFAALPERLASVGLYRYVSTLARFGRDDPHAIARDLEVFVTRLASKRWYPELQPAARSELTIGVQLTRSILGTMRADGRIALESAEAMEGSGFAVYTMMASAIRSLYHLNRGEAAEAERHAARVELHAARFGSAWQIECWRDAALIPLYSVTEDVVALRRVAGRLDELGKSNPTLAFYARLARLAMLGAAPFPGSYERAQTATDVWRSAPRSFMGWAAAEGLMAHAEIVTGQVEAARARCVRVLTELREEDHEYVTLFLPVSLSMALAEAATGEVEAGLARLDALLVRFAHTPHPLAHGFLHETRARILWNAARVPEFKAEVEAAGRWFKPTRTPSLIARYDRLLALPASGTRSLAPKPAVAQDLIATMHGE